jgi:hypothetical protein
MTVVHMQGLLLLHEVPERHRTVLGDEAALKRIIINLVRCGVTRHSLSMLYDDSMSVASASLTRS